MDDGDVDGGVKRKSLLLFPRRRRCCCCCCRCCRRRRVFADSVFRSFSRSPSQTFTSQYTLSKYVVAQEGGSSEWCTGGRGGVCRKSKELISLQTFFPFSEIFFHSQPSVVVNTTT